MSPTIVDGNAIASEQYSLGDVKESQGTGRTTITQTVSEQRP
jgi:hypothetical protein